MKADISVIIPTYNCADFLPAAIESVLKQSHLAAEVLVIDDGSTDSTAAEMKQFPSVRYHLTSRAGAAAARNFGVRLSQCDFIAFLDADDLWLPNKLDWQVAAFEADPLLDMVFGHVEQFLSPEVEGKVTALNVGVKLPGYVPGTLLIKKASFLRVGPLAETYRLGEFIDWYMRAREAQLNSQIIRPVVLRRRIHGNNMGITELDARTDYASILKTALDRRRNGAVHT